MDMVLPKNCQASGFFRWKELRPMMEPKPPCCRMAVTSRSTGRMTRRPVPPSLPWFERRARLVQVPWLSLPYQLKIFFTLGVFIRVAFDRPTVQIVPFFLRFHQRRAFHGVVVAGPRLISPTPLRIHERPVPARISQKGL